MYNNGFRGILKGAISDGFMKRSVETVNTKNFIGFFFKHLPQKGHQTVTADIKSLSVTNPHVLPVYLPEYGHHFEAQMLNSITNHVNLQEDLHAEGRSHLHGEDL